jgi:hypothetical protein
LSTVVYFKFGKSTTIEKSIQLFYKVKLASTVSWLLESIIFLIIRILLSIENETLIVEYILVRTIKKIADRGEPMQPAEFGQRIEIKHSSINPPQPENFIVESTEIMEITSYPTKMFEKEKHLPENKEVQIKDFTSNPSSAAIRKYSKELNEKSKRSDNNKDSKDTKMLRNSLKVEDLNTIN